MQASILGLYDPDRSQAVTYRGRPRAWNEALSALRGALDKLKTRQGAGLCILTENVASPTLHAQLTELLDNDHFPKAKWYQYEPAGRSTVLEGAKLAFGEYVNTYLRFHRRLTSFCHWMRISCSPVPARCVTPTITAIAAACGRKTHR